MNISYRSKNREKNNLNGTIKVENKNEAMNHMKEIRKAIRKWNRFTEDKISYEICFEINGL